MPPVKQSQDRKPKAAERIAGEVKGSTYRFTHDGKTYELPPASSVVTKIGADVLMDFVEAADALAEVRLGVALLKAAAVDEETMQALRSKTAGEFAEILVDWMQASGGDPGESERSSD